jgi:hypothetical protein
MTLRTAVADPVSQIDGVTVRPLGEVCGFLKSVDTQVIEYEQEGGAEFPVMTQFVDLVHSNRPVDVRLDPSRLRSSASNRGGIFSVVNTLSRYVAPIAIARTPDPIPIRFPDLEKRRSVIGVNMIRFHPHSQLIAVAQQQRGIASDAVVELYDVGKGSSTGHTLNHEFQRRVSAMEWKPCSEAVLAVGIQGGALVWHCTFSLQCCVALGRQPSHFVNRTKPPRFPVVGDCFPEQLHSVEPGACLWFPSTNGTRVTEIKFSTATGRIMVLASDSSNFLDVYDVSKPPAQGRIAVLSSARGPTSCLAFTRNDQYLCQGIHGSNWMHCWTTEDWRRFAISVGNPVTSITALAVSQPSAVDDFLFDLNYSAPPTLLLAFEKTEYLLVATLSKTGQRTRWRHFVSSVAGVSQIRLNPITRIATTGTTSGDKVRVGGRVVQLSAHVGKSCTRVAVELESGQVLLVALFLGMRRAELSRAPAVAALSAIGEGDRFVDCDVEGIGLCDPSGCMSDADVSAGHGLVFLDYFPGCTRGSLLAYMLSDGQLRFLPSYSRM